MLKFKNKSDKAGPCTVELVKRLIIKRVLSLANQNKEKVNLEKVNLENVILFLIIFFLINIFRLFYMQMDKSLKKAKLYQI